MQKAGVKRFSMDVSLYAPVMGDPREAAAQLADGDLASASECLDFGDVMTMISEATRPKAA